MRGRRAGVTAAVTACALALSTAAGLPGGRHMRPVIVSGPVRHAVTVPVGEPLNAAQTEQMLGPPGLPTLHATTAPAASAGAVPHSPSDIHMIIDGTVTGVVVYVLTKVGEKAGRPIWKAAKKYILKKIKGSGSHTGLYTNSGDGRCPGVWGRGQQPYEANCGDKTGIYWWYTGTGRLWNTHTGDALIAPSATDGAKPFVWPSVKDWYTWTWGNVCGSCGCTSCFDGIVWALYNSQTHEQSDTTAASVQT